MLDGFSFLPGESTKIIDYFMPLTDSYGYVHSIDNIVTFYRTNISVDDLLEVVRAKSKTFAYLEYWERCDLPVRRNFANFIHEVHFGDLFIRIGKRKEDKTSYGAKTVRVIDCVRFEINPNKHHATKEWDFMLELIDQYCVKGIIDKFDYAIDIPVPKEKVVVLKSRKTVGLFNGTRYFGKRNKHGYVKIYDKYKERLDEAKVVAKKFDLTFVPEEAARPCTRVEITLQNRQPFSGVEFGVAGLTESESSDLPELSETLRIYLDMLEHILLLGGDVDGHLRKINYRSRVKLEPHLYGAVVNYEFDMEILGSLLRNLEQLLKLEPYVFKTRALSGEDFVPVDFDFEDLEDLLPFPGEL